MPAGDLYVLRHQGAMFGENIENVYHFEQTLGSTGAADLNNSFMLTILPKIRDILSVAWDSQQVLITNLDDPTDFTTTLMPGSGLRGGEGMPTFVGFGFTLFSTDQRVRSGGKRYAGISEGDVDSGVAGAVIVPLLTALSAILLAPLQNPGATSEWKLILYTPGNLKTLGAPLRVPIASISYRRVTTQNTRKPF